MDQQGKKTSSSSPDFSPLTLEKEIEQSLLQNSSVMRDVIPTILHYYLPLSQTEELKSKSIQCALLNTKGIFKLHSIVPQKLFLVQGVEKIRKDQDDSTSFKLHDNFTLYDHELKKNFTFPKGKMDVTRDFFIHYTEPQPFISLYNRQEVTQYFYQDSSKIKPQYVIREAKKTAFGDILDTRHFPCDLKNGYLVVRTPINEDEEDEEMTSESSSKPSLHWMGPSDSSAPFSSASWVEKWSRELKEQAVIQITSSFIIVLYSKELEIYTHDNLLWWKSSLVPFLHRFHPQCQHWSLDETVPFVGALELCFPLPGSNTIILSSTFFQRTKHAKSKNLALKINPNLSQFLDRDDIATGYFLLDLEQKALVKEGFGLKSWAFHEDGPPEIVLDEWGSVVLYWNQSKEILQVDLFHDGGINDKELGQIVERLMKD